MEQTENIQSANNLNPNETGILDNLPIGLVFFDAEFKINYANQCLKSFRIFNDEILDKGVITNQKFESDEITKSLLSLKDGNFFEKELKKIKTLSGGEISIIVKGVPLFENENFSGGILIVEDLTVLYDVRFDDIFSRKDYFEKIIQKISSLFFIVDASEKILFSAGNKIQSLLKKKNITAGESLSSIFSNEINEKISASFIKVKEEKIEENTVVDIEIDHELSRFEIQITPLLDNRQQVKFIFINFNDISLLLKEVEKFQNELKELKQYQIITETTTDAVVGLDLNGKILFWNKASDKLFGFKKSEVFGKQLGKIIYSFDENDFSEFNKILLKEKSYQANLTFLTKQKEKKVGQFSFSLSEIGENDQSILILCQDITEKDKIEKELRLTEERYRTIVQSSSDLICNFDNNGKIIYVNPAFYNLLKYNEGEISKIKIQDIFNKEFYQQNNLTISILVNAKTNNFEVTLQDKFGEKSYHIVNFSTVYNTDGSVKYYSGIFTNITLKKAVEQELKMMHSIFEASNDGIAVELEGKFILVNTSFAKMCGYNSTEELIGINSMDIVAQEEVNRILDFTKERISKKDIHTHYEFLARKKDGSNFYAEVSVTYFEFDKKIFVVIIARDVTERKRVQQAIKESEERYRSITENINDFFWTAERIENKLRTIFYTASVVKITGYSQAEMIKDSKSFFRIIFPDDVKTVKNKIKKLYQNIYKNSDEIEFRIIHKQGNIVWVKNKFNLIRDKKGHILKIFGLVSDVSLPKKAEEEVKISSENLKKLNETKDRFISIISHDLRTPFSSILGFTDLLLSDDELSKEEVKQYVQFIKESSQNMLALVNSLLDWTRLQTGRIKFEPSKFDISDVVTRSLNSLIGFAQQKKIKLINNIEKEIYTFIDVGLMLQVFNNLVSNSIKFTNENGSVTINASTSNIPRFIEIEVNDTGVGISKENANKIFSVDSKFTTDGTSGEKGTGLGLSLVKEIIEKHGGKIWVESKLGKGTSFKFTIPKASASILLVDDSNTDRILYSKLLKSITEDYRIIQAVNGKDAYEKILELSPALVITDHFMPEMTGYELINRIKESNIKGKPPFIILSGDIGKSEVIAYNDIGVEYVFQKPVNLRTFKEAVEKSLHKMLK